MKNFSELPISNHLKAQLAEARFTTPTPVQAAAIPQAMEGKDVLATAQTGTGKTLAFLIPIIEKLTTRDAAGIAALVLVPTRELAMQVVEQYNVLRGRQLAPAALVVGGLSEEPQLAAIRKGARIVIATSGRLEDFLDRRLVQLGAVQTLVLDEADRMLDMGFLPDSQNCRDSAEGPADDVLLGDARRIRGTSHEGLHEKSGTPRIRVHAQAFRECTPAGVRDLRRCEAGNALSPARSREGSVSGFLTHQARHGTNYQGPDSAGHQCSHDSWRPFTVSADGRSRWISAGALPCASGNGRSFAGNSRP